MPAMQPLSEADTRAKLIDPALHYRGWTEGLIRRTAELKERMAQADALQSALRNQKSALEALPQAILQKAFKGQM